MPTSSGVGAPHAPPENAEAQMRAWLPGVVSTRCTHAAIARPSGATASAAETTGPAPAPASIGAAGSHAACCGRRERGHQRRGPEDRAKRHAAQATHR